MSQALPKCEHFSAGEKTRCTKFAQVEVLYILNRQSMCYRYCPPHKREVESHLNKLGITYAVRQLEVSK